MMQLALYVPLLGALGIALCGRHPNLRETVTLVTAVLLFALVTGLFLQQDAARETVMLVETLPGLSLALAMEPLGLLFALVASGLWVLTSVYAIGYMRGNEESHQTRFYVCFAVSLSAAMGVALAANMFTLFVFYEVLTLATYPLVAHKGTEEARRGGRVYLGLLLSTSIGFLLVALIWTWDVAGTLDFTPGGILGGKIDESLLPWLLAL